MRSLVIFGLVALTRAFPNPQESDDDLLADIDGNSIFFYKSTINKLNKRKDA
jgi:hypothetical protein